MFAHGAKLQYIRPNFVGLTPQHAPPAGDSGYICDKQK